MLFLSKRTREAQKKVYKLLKQAFCCYRTQIRNIFIDVFSHWKNFFNKDRTRRKSCLFWHKFLLYWTQRTNNSWILANHIVFMEYLKPINIEMFQKIRLYVCVERPFKSQPLYACESVGILNGIQYAKICSAWISLKMYCLRHANTHFVSIEFKMSWGILCKIDSFFNAFVFSLPKYINFNTHFCNCRILAMKKWNGKRRQENCLPNRKRLKVSAKQT